VIEDGAPVPVTGPVIDVAMVGVRGLILGLASDEDIYVLRDPSAPPVVTEAAGRVWLQTSGTTGTPKWVAHSRESLMARVAAGDEPARWLLTFNPGSFAGLQVILSAMAGPHTLVVPDYGASVTSMADQAVAQSVTHISGTPTFWRAFLMVLGARPLNLKGVTLGGEAADQAILDALRLRFSDAHLRHIYATTELGALLSVSDGRAGFPRDWLEQNHMAITEHGTLMIKGFDTGDVVELTEDRVLFKGRLDSMINVGGVKVNPESVEAHILALTDVQDVRVSGQPNPLTGHILVADIVLKPDAARDSVEAQIRAHINTLPRAHRPARLRFVEALDIGATGKKLRSL
jgi:acyl-coenzyme A synthetase/AMP-(fatty) acid ligase